MRRRNLRRQAGFTLLDTLVALLIFTIGLLGLSAMYVRAAVQPFQNQQIAGAQLAANALFATLSVDPSVLPLQLSNAASPSAMPSTALSDWFQQYAQQLPGLKVSVVSQNDATGTACSSTSCGVQLTLQWTQGSAQRLQQFHGQIGLR